MALFAENIPKDVYLNLIRTVEEHLPLLHRYLALRKRRLGLDELHMYDLFVPLVDGFDMNISYEEAKRIVAESLRPLGDEYLRILREGFENGWIDVYETRASEAEPTAGERTARIRTCC